ncbi:MAG: trigger factor [bacterium]|nr:trigger factor [bacterium]
MADTKYEIKEKRDLPESMTEIVADLGYDFYDKYRTRAVAKLNSEISLDGFRKGYVPEDVLVKALGEFSVVEECARMAVEEAVPHIVMENERDTLGRPSVSIKTLAKGNPLIVSIKLAKLPKIELPDYKKISAEVNAGAKPPEEASEKEVDEALINIRRYLKQTSEQGKMADEKQKTETENLPELTDALAQTFGNFKNLAEFRENLRRDVSADKKRKSKEKVRLHIVEELTKGMKMELPKVLVDGELQRMESEFKQDIIRFGVKVEDYLKQAGKSLQNLREEWTEHAKKRVTMELVIFEISKKENIMPAEEMIEKEVSHLKDHLKDASEDNLRSFVTNMLTKEKVFEFLESI